jgi:gliding motility-associated-like protein
MVHFTNNSIGAASSSWKFDAKDSSAQQNPEFDFKNKGNYPVKLTVTSPAGCIDSAIHLIVINEDANNNLFIPNVFTPNGDLFNNTFLVTGLNKCYTYDISIYNRWGQLYYHGTGNHLEWDGYNHGFLVPEGVYYYVFHGKEEGELKGCITVLY